MPATDSRRMVLGYALSLSSVALFAFNGTVSKTIMATGIPVERLAQLRVSFAFVVLLLWVAWRNPRSLRIGSWRELRLLAAYGVFGVMLTQYLYFVSIERIPVGITLIIEYTAPLIVALWFRLRHRERFARGVWTGLGVALAGLVLIAQVWDGFVLDGVGVAAAFGAALAFSAYFVMAEAATAAPYRRDSVSVVLYGFAATTVVWAVLQPWWGFPWHYLQGPSAPWSALELRLPLPLLAAVMVLVGTVVAFSLNVLALQHLRAAQASAVGMAEPVLASLIAWTLIGESLGAWQIAGILVASAGILIAERSRLHLG